MDWVSIGAIIGALGGFEAVKYLLNRKTNSRIALAEAESKEFHNFQETFEWLQQQLQKKEERFEEQTQLVRRLQTEKYDLARQIAELEIAHAREVADIHVEMAEVKCQDDSCPFRLPPNAKTPPLQGLTRKQFAALRDQLINSVNAFRSKDNE